MIVYVKDSHGIRQMPNIDYISIDSNMLVGYFEDNIVWTIEFENKRHAIGCYLRVKDDINHGHSDVLIYTDKGDVIE